MQKIFKNKVLMLVLCTIVEIFLQIRIVLNNMMLQTSNVIHLGRGVVPINSVNGAIQAVMFLACVIMVLAEYKKGLIISLVLQGFSLVSILIRLIKFGELATLPGCLNLVFYIICLMIIGFQFRKIERDSITDYTSGLYNRRGFVHKLQQKLNSKKKGTLMYLQFMNIREINDNIGHEYGDKIIVEAIRKVASIVGTKEIMFKMDGAEIAVLLPEDMDPEKITVDILKVLGEKITITKNSAEINYYLISNVGITRFPEDTSDATTLMKYADIALLASIQRGDNKYEFFSQEMEKGMLRQAEVERMVKSGLDNDYFYLVYQPQYEIKNKVLRGFETLIRMKMPDGTMISPAEFIKIAEMSDLILRIDDYVLKNAILGYLDVCKNGDLDMILSVNVSAKSMSSIGFGKKVLDLLEKYQFPAKNLEIEITEYSFSESEDLTSENIQVLIEHGVQIALDDFGTGYTSLAQLLNLPIQLLKIDKSLIDNIESNEQNQAFLDAVIYMGHIMGCEVICEGVETENQLALLEKHNCEFVQGYVWGKPMAYGDAMALLKEQKLTVN